MKRTIRPMALAVSTAALAMASTGASAADNATATKSALAASQIEEVIVTARKTEESAQVVPVSVTALSAETMAKLAVLSVQDLRTSVPGLYIAINPQGAAPTFAIRAAKAANGTSDTVTAYVGDMPVASTKAIANMVYDMQSISVLKGPQGTLFGANSTGGAIIFRPNMPSNEFEGYAELGVGNYDRSSFQGMINVPINDVVQMRLAGEIVDRKKGFQHNLTPVNGNSQMGTDKHESARFTLRIKPSTAFQNDLVVDYFHEDDQPQSSVTSFLRPRFVSSVGLTADFAAAGIFASTDTHTVRLGPFPTWNKAKIWDFVDTVSYEINQNASFKAVLGYQDISLDVSQDNDATPTATLAVITADKLKQWSFEPSLDLKSDDGRLRNKTGLFFSSLKRDTGNSSAALGLPFTVANANFPVASNAYYNRETKSHAIYSQFSYDLTKELTATLGLRYSWDKGQYKATNRNGVGLNIATRQTATGMTWGSFFTGPCNPGLANYQNFNAVACTGEQSLKSQAPSFTFTLEDKFAERSMVYATLRGGYLVGGFNNQVYTAGGFGQVFLPEKVVDFETGLKSDWDLWGRPIRTNLAVYYSNYKNQQRTQNGTTATGTTFTAVQNAGASTVYGFDLDATYEVTDNLELSASWNHVESEYTTFNAALNVPGVVVAVDLTGQPLSQTPRDRVNLSATVKWPLDSSVGKVSSTLGYFWSDKTTTQDQPTFACVPVNGFCSAPTSAAVDFRQYDKLPAFDLWNFTTSWKGIMGSNFDANLWIKNITDKKYNTYAGNTSLLFGYVGNFWGAPREFGLNVRYNF